MTRQRQPRKTDPAYLAWLRKQRCACGCLKGPPCDAAHIRATSFIYEKHNPGIGAKPDDKWALPLWHDCHMDQHAHGNELDWWQWRGIRDPFALAIKHYRQFRQEREGTRKHKGNPKGAGRPRKGEQGMIGQIIAVGEYIGRWLYVTRTDEQNIYGRVWVPTRQRWSKKDVWYALSAIDKQPPQCPKPAHPPPQETR